MNRTYTNQYVLASKMLKTTKLLFISLCSMWLKTSAKSAKSASKKFVPIRVHSWMINTQYAILDTRDDIASTTVEDSLQIRLFMQNKPNFRKSQMNVSDLQIREYEKMDTWSSGKNKANSNPIQTQNEPNLSRRSLWRSRNEPKSCPPSVWRIKKAKMNVTTFITRNYEQLTTNYEQLTTNYELIKTNPTCRGVASGEAGSKPISKAKKC